MSDMHPHQMAVEIQKVIKTWANWYETRQGQRLLAARVSEMPMLMRDYGWKNVSRKFSDPEHYRKLGTTVVSAQYVGGPRKSGRFVDVVVLNTEEK